MHRKVRRLVRLLAVMVIAAGGSAVAASPARAAVPDPVFIQVIGSYHCLQQIYVGASPSVWVNVIHPCSRIAAQQWGVQRVTGTPYYRVVNHKSNWCLSHPNFELGSSVFTEVCVNSNKQLWILEARPDGGAYFVNAYTGYCMGPGYDDAVRGYSCHPPFTVDRWMWSTNPV